MRDRCRLALLACSGRPAEKPLRTRRRHGRRCCIRSSEMECRMPRQRKCRRITERPHACEFKPVGVPGRSLPTIELTLDELEALRLADAEGQYHDEAARRMDISRPTFSRLVDAARHKVATALITGCRLVFHGGNVTVGEVRTFACLECQQNFELAHGGGPPEACPHCGGVNFRRVDGTDRGGRCRRRGGRGGGRGRHGPPIPPNKPETRGD